MKYAKPRTRIVRLGTMPDLLANSGTPTADMSLSIREDIPETLKDAYPQAKLFNAWE